MVRGAIVIGAHVNGLGVIRALAARRVPVVVVSTRHFDIAQHSRWVVEGHRLFSLHHQHETLIELLEHHAKRREGWTIFPTNDDALTALAQHHERLSRSYRLTVQTWDVVSHLVDKDRMHALAERVGLNLPQCLGPAGTEVPSAAPLSFPIVVKPIQHDRLISSFGTKLFLVGGAEELLIATRRLRETGLSGLMFDFIPGPDSNIYVYCVYVDAQGEPSEGITIRKLRQNPPLIGGARAVEVVPDIPELREATVELLRRAGFRGMAYAEFKLDPRTQRFLFIEVNTRAVLFNSVLPPTGVDLVARTWMDFGLGQNLRLQPTGWSGTWVHLQADLRCWLSYRHVEHLRFSDWVAPYRRPRVLAVWSATDPMPFLAQTALAVRGARDALRHRRQPPDSERQPASRDT